MSDEYADPSGNTQAFRAFVERGDPAPARSRLPIILGAAGVAALIILLVVLILALG
jgi:hypothetical protein